MLRVCVAFSVAVGTVFAGYAVGAEQIDPIRLAAAPESVRVGLSDTVKPEKPAHPNDSANATGWPGAEMSATHKSPPADGPTGTIALKTSSLSATSSLAWETFARSIEGRPLEMLRIGRDSSHRVLVVGPLHGDALTALALVDRLAEHLSKFPDRVGHQTVTIVRLANPDGYVRGQATNAHGVDLNRNFASSDWRKVREHDHWLSGRLPQSEPETNALANLIDDLQAERIVSIGSAGSRARVRYVAVDDELAGRVAAAAGAKLITSEDSTGSGSLASYAGTDRGIATLIVDVPRGASVGDNWARFSDSLLLAIRGMTRRSGSGSNNPAGERTAPSLQSGSTQTEAPQFKSGAASRATDENTKLGTRILTILKAIGFLRQKEDQRAGELAAPAGTGEPAGGVHQPPGAPAAFTAGGSLPAKKGDSLRMIPVVSPPALRRQLESNRFLKNDMRFEANRKNAQLEPPPKVPVSLFQRAAKPREPAPTTDAKRLTPPDPRVRRLPPVEGWRQNANVEQQQPKESVRWPQPPIPHFSEPRDSID